MIKKTVVTFGSIALELERAKLAKSGNLGGQSITLEHMVERLSGGFLRIVDMMTLREIVSQCLPDTFISELEPIKSRPGMTNACSKSLMAWWMSGLNNEDYLDIPRLQSLFLLEKEVEARLPAHMKKPADLVNIAISKANFIPRLFGEISFHGMTDLHPVWRPILEAMTHLDGYVFQWNAGALPKPDFLNSLSEGSYRVLSKPEAKPVLSAVSCSDAHHEVVEAIRWAFELLDQGVKGEDIAIAAVSSGPYEAFFETELKALNIDIHLAHGTPILMKQEGQECAALADILIRGVSQKRVRRLARIGQDNQFFSQLPEKWLDRLPADAGLRTIDRWQRLLSRNDMKDINEIILPVIETFFEGVSVALDIGRTVLSEEAFRVWEYALKMAPASALDVTLKSMKDRPSGSALTRTCFMTASNLVSAPRKHVRLLGLSSKQWPRQDGEDSLIPSYIIPRDKLSPMSISEIDKRDFHSILKSTENSIIFSRPRMDGDGREQRSSTLIPDRCEQTTTHLDPSRNTKYAMCEHDRLFMRAAEFSKLPEAIRAKDASSNWTLPKLTQHDGAIPEDHPQIVATFEQIQSPTSLQKMIRDPLGYVWKYALGFRAPEYQEEPLLVDPRVFGNIVHEILKKSVERLNLQKGGFALANKVSIDVAVHKARLSTGASMEQRQPIPPILIWSQTLDKAEEIAREALMFDRDQMKNTNTYVEIPFGGSQKWIKEETLWASEKDVTIPGTPIKVQGIIDRLEISEADNKITKSRVIDYKTGKTPSRPESIGIAGGKELQRVIYKHAVDTLLDGAGDTTSALLYPATNTYMPMLEADENIKAVTAAIQIAIKTLRNGYAYPGIDSSEAFNDLLFIFPARAENVYLAYKQSLIGDEFEGLRNVWNTQ